MRATPSSRDRADEGGWSVVSSLELFVHNLDLLVDYLPGETVDGHACLAEALAKAGVPSNAALLPRRSRFEDS